MKKLSVHFYAFLLLSLIASSSHGMMCVDLFTLKELTYEEMNTDPRDELDRLLRAQPNALLKIGEGNSAEVHLTRKSDGTYVVLKIYREKMQDKLDRDHQGLQLLQLFFEKNSLHDSHFNVVKSTMIPNFQKTGVGILEMPFVEGVNLHKLLVHGSPNDPIVQMGRELYAKMVDELYDFTQMRGFRDEIRPETPLYFRDHVVDGMPMLDISGKQHLLIKTDNIIFNPKTQTLTIVDPF